MPQVLAGGRLVRPEGGGQFYAPTVLAGVTPAMRVWREEVFGPVRPLPKLRLLTEHLVYHRRCSRSLRISHVRMA